MDITSLKLGIIGLGFVGDAMYKSFLNKGIDVNGYDKYKNGGIGKLSHTFPTDILFIALPTPHDSITHKYDLSSIYETFDKLEKKKYNGVIVIKCTIAPLTTFDLSVRYKNLHIMHNPEFLTARTAYEDFNNQKHIVLGSGPNCSQNDMDIVTQFYNYYFPCAEISQCTSIESESMKIFANSFYATKIQFFTEMYLLCNKTNCDYNIVRNMMLKNGWINEMHTIVPGRDSKVSFGGGCFPKDVSTLNCFMETMETPHKVIDSVITERNEMRKDDENIIHNNDSAINKNKNV